MDREKAIQMLKRCEAESHCEHYKRHYCCIGCGQREALDLAIEALGDAESATTTDCISRQQAIEAFCDDCRGLKPVQCEHWDKCKSQKVLRSLPPVTPTERTGECEKCRNHKLIKAVENRSKQNRADIRIIIKAKMKGGTENE